MYPRSELKNPDAQEDLDIHDFYRFDKELGSFTLWTFSNHLSFPGVPLVLWERQSKNQQERNSQSKLSKRELLSILQLLIRKELKEESLTWWCFIFRIGSGNSHSSKLISIFLLIKDLNFISASDWSPQCGETVWNLWRRRLLLHGFGTDDRWRSWFLPFISPL